MSAVRRVHPEEIRRLRAAGTSDQLIAVQLGVTVGAIDRAMYRAEPQGGPSTPDVTAAPYPRFDGTQACHGSDADFFPTPTGSPRGALRLCRSCPFVKPCLAYALTHRVDGVWGGTTAEQRDDIRTRHHIIPLPVLADAPDDDEIDAARARQRERTNVQRLYEERFAQ